MSGPVVGSQRIFQILRAILYCLTLFFWLPRAYSQESSQGANLALEPVLDQQEVNLGERTILYNRIATPDLKPEVALPTTSTEPTPKPLTPQEQAEIQKDAVRQYLTLFLSCTEVEGTGWTELRFWDQAHEVTAWSNINFKMLGALLDFNTDSNGYNLMFTHQKVTLADVQVSNTNVQNKGPSPGLLVVVPQQAANSSGKSVYQFMAPELISEQAHQAMEDLHNYVDTHHELIAQRYQEREAIRLAEEKELRDNPPKPKDTVIQYFPIHSRENQ